MSNKQRRKKYYTDHKLQGGLLAALIVLEITLVSLALLYLYTRFSVIIEANLFKIHAADNSQTLPAMFSELMLALSVLLLCNIVALIVAHFIWEKYVRYIIYHFKSILNSMFHLDFSGHKDITPVNHEVITILEQWRNLERNRCFQIRALCNSLDKQMILNPVEHPTTLSILGELKSLLTVEPRKIEVR